MGRRIRRNYVAKQIHGRMTSLVGSMQRHGNRTGDGEAVGLAILPRSLDRFQHSGFLLLTFELVTNQRPISVTCLPRFKVKFRDRGDQIWI